MPKILVGYVWDLHTGGIDGYLRVFDAYARGKGIEIDYLTTEKNRAFEAELALVGSKLFETSTLSHPKDQYRQVFDLIATGDYDAAYFNFSTAAVLPSAQAAFDAGCPRIAIHSHAAGLEESNPIKRILIRLIHERNKKKISRIGNLYLGASLQAGTWMFTKELVESDKFRVVHNPVDADRFAFDEAKRISTRAMLGLSDNFIVGTVSGLRSSKNIPFLIEIFSHIVDQRPEAMLIIVGDGEERERIERLIAKRSLTEKVLMLGKRDDIPELLSAFDAFVMPSVFEGLGTAGVEAQAADLRCFFSTGVPLEAKVLDDCEFISLDEPASYWASRICEVEIDGVRGNRLKNNRQALFESGYSGSDTIFSWLDGFLKQ